MASSLSKQPLLLILLSLFLLCLPLALARGNHRNRNVAITYHRGPLLTGKVDLAFLWYGPFGRVQKHAVRSFVKSLNYNKRSNLRPQVSAWWRIVESYQTLGRRRRGNVPPIKIKVVKQITDKGHTYGKVLTIDFITPLVQKAAAAGNRKTLVVIFAGRGVAVHKLCMGKCALHGFIGNQPYVVVGEPETECPGSCAWPFHPSDHAPGPVYRPPNGNVGADAMVIALASGLAEAVTNPFNTGFFGGIKFRPVEIASRCPDMFGSRSSPGNPGKVLIDRRTGGAFNAHGTKGTKFLLPAIWNPLTKSCWTMM